MSVDEIQTADPGADPSEQLERAQLSRRLEDAIARLEGRCRELFRLKLEGRTFAEIQSLMAVGSINTVYTWDARCRKRLLEMMHET